MCGKVEAIQFRDLPPTEPEPVLRVTSPLCASTIHRGMTTMAEARHCAALTGDGGQRRVTVLH